MNFQGIVGKRVRSVAVILFWTMVCGVRVVFANELPPLEKLPEACRTAKAAFRPLTQTDLANAKQVLDQAVERLDRRVQSASENGAEWRKYVQLDRLQQEVGDPLIQSPVKSAKAQLRPS